MARAVEKHANKALALDRAKTQSKTESYVAVIESENLYFIEYEPTMVRNWEKMLVEYEDGKETSNNNNNN